MTGSASVVIEQAQGLAILRLNRPSQGNAFDLAQANAFRDAARAVADDDRVRCVVLTGTGRFFCVGGDVQAFAATSTPETVIAAIAGDLHEGMSLLARMAKPLVVMVNGPAAGAGLGLAMLGDIVFAAASSHFTMAYTALGLTPDAGSTWLLPRLVGLRRAQDMTFTNRRVGAEEAERIGLITRAVADTELEEEAMAVARRLAQGPTAAFAGIRRLFAKADAAGFEEQMEAEAAAIAGAASGLQGREGVTAFLEKRQPRFDCAVRAGAAASSPGIVDPSPERVSL